MAIAVAKSGDNSFAMKIVVSHSTPPWVLTSAPHSVAQAAGAIALAMPSRIGAVHHGDCFGIWTLGMKGSYLSVTRRTHARPDMGPALLASTMRR